MRLIKFLVTIVVTLSIFTGTASLPHAQGNQEETNVNNDRVEEVKEKLINGLDVAIERLEALKRKIESNKNIPEERRNQIVKRIELRIDFLQKKKAEIKDANTLFEIREVVSDIRESAKKEYGQRFKDGMGLRIADKAKLAYITAEKIYRGLSAKVAGLKNDGEDVSELESKLEEVRGYLDNARKKLGEARILIRSFDEAKLREWLQNMKMVHEDLKEVMENLKSARDLMEEIRENLERI